jgi:hypothetical protein
VKGRSNHRRRPRGARAGALIGPDLPALNATEIIPGGLSVGGTHGGELTVGELRRLIADLPADTRIIGEVHDDGEQGWTLCVHDCELSGATILLADPDDPDDVPIMLHLSLSRMVPLCSNLSGHRWGPEVAGRRVCEYCEVDSITGKYPEVLP